MLGTAAAEYQKILLWCVLAIYVLQWMHSIGKAGGKPAELFLWTAAFAAVAVCGVYNSYHQKAFRNTYVSLLKDGEKCLVQGEIYRKEEKEQNLFYLKNCKMQYHQKNYSCNQILLYLKAEEYAVGEILCVQGKIQTFDLPVNEGGYNEREYYQSLGIDFKLIGTHVTGVYGQKDAVREWLYGIKARLKESFQKVMRDADAGVLMAMTLGDKSGMEDSRKNLYQSAGISHFYSISGLHISLIGMALYYAVRKRGAGYVLSGGIAAAIIFWYGELTGFGISTKRAAGMFFLLLYAKCRGRSYDRMTALALMAAVFAAENPALLHHAGYLLSFGAICGILLAEWVTEGWESGNKLKEALCVSFCIQITTIPIMCVFFYEISVYSAFINILIVPCVGILLGLGIAGGIAGCFFASVGEVLLYPCRLLLWLFDLACESFLRLPGASLITGKISFSALLLWYGSIFMLVVIYRKPKMRLAVLASLPVVFLLALQRPASLELDILDVGQGDGIYLSMGEGTTMFIDGGSSSVKKVGTYRILPFLKYKGAKKIDYWFVSHCDADHINGLYEVMESGYTIDHLVVSKYMPEDDAWENLKNMAESKRVEILKMGRGDFLRGQKNDWSIKCLSLRLHGTEQDRNALSLALLLESDALRAFFAGDIGELQEKELAREWNLPNVDLYKASHHGSDYSGCRELLCRIKPKITVISCGLKNSYGHPGKKAVERILETGSSIYETRFSGQIKIRGVRLEVEEFLVL